MMIYFQVSIHIRLPEPNPHSSSNTSDASNPNSTPDPNKFNFCENGIMKAQFPAEEGHPVTKTAPRRGLGTLIKLCLRELLPLRVRTVAYVLLPSHSSIESIIIVMCVIYLVIYLPLCLSVYPLLSIRPSTSLSIYLSLSVYLTLCLSVYLPLSIRLSNSLSICLSTSLYPSI